MAAGKKKYKHKEDIIQHKTIRLTVDTWKRIQQKKLDMGSEVTFDDVVAELLDDAGY